MSNPAQPPPCYVDAPGWGDTVTAEVDLNYDGTQTIPDTGSGSFGKSGVTRTGNTTFTWTRETLASRLTALGGSPKFPASSYGVEMEDDGSQVTVKKGKFLALAGAYGKMPGWIVIFGAQDAVKDGITVTTYTSGEHRDPPPYGPGDLAPSSTVTHEDIAPVALSATCSLAAPNRPVFVQASAAPNLYADGVVGSFDPANGVVSLIVTPSQGEDHSDTTIQVELVQPQQAATSTAPAVGPIYRVTIPNDCDLDASGSDGSGLPGDFAYVYVDGDKYPTPNDSGLTGLDSLAQIAGAVAGDDGNYGRAYYRASNVCDVQLPYGHTMSEGKIPGYQGFDPAPSKAYASGGGLGDYSHDIDNPFPMTGQSFVRPASTASGGTPSDGLTVTIQF